MVNLIILILGDLTVNILQGFYMGVGIRQSAGLLNILGMTLPTLVFWVVSAWLLKIYQFIPAMDLKRAAEEPDAEEPPKKRFALLRMLDSALHAQQLLRLVLVWTMTSLFAVFSQTWYWNHVLGFERGISVRFTLFFCLAGIYFLIIWRALWTAFVIVRQLARSHRWVRALCYLVVLLLVLFQIPPLVLTAHYAPVRYTLAEYAQSQPDTAIVYGAGVYRNGTASSVLRDRVETAVELYQRGAVRKLLMSGDNSAVSRYETDVMARIAEQMGVPAADILHDEKGLSTTSTCENAVNEFGLRAAVLVTQDFHTTRALYTCAHAGLNGVSVAADRSVYNIFSWLLWQLRDWAGLSLTWIKYTFWL